MQQRLPGVPEVVNAALEIWFSPDKKHFALFNTGIDMVFSIELYEKLKAFSTVSDSDPFSEGAKRVYFSTGADQTFSVQFQDIESGKIKWVNTASKRVRNKFEKEGA